MGSLGRYEVVRELKTGGMATATLARSPSGRLVVAKRPITDDPDLASRMRDEARVGARVQHAHLVETLDFFEHERRPVLVVEYIRGVSMSELRRQGPLPTPAVARIGAQIASALRALHEATDETGTPLNVLHRDVSPANVLVDEHGDAHLIDLGIAKWDGGRSALTETGQIVGTLSYMAPELFADGNYSTASDLWSLGVVLLEAAIGRPAFSAPSAGMLIARVSRFESLEQLGVADMNGALRAVLGDLMAPVPHRRPTTMEAEERLASLGGTTAQTTEEGNRALADAVARLLATAPPAAQPPAAQPPAAPAPAAEPALHLATRDELRRDELKLDITPHTRESGARQMRSSTWRTARGDRLTRTGDELVIEAARPIPGLVASRFRQSVLIVRDERFALLSEEGPPDRPTYRMRLVTDNLYDRSGTEVHYDELASEAQRSRAAALGVRVGVGVGVLVFVGGILVLASAERPRPPEPVKIVSPPAPPPVPTDPVDSTTAQRARDRLDTLRSSACDHPCIDTLSKQARIRPSMFKVTQFQDSIAECARTCGAP